MSAWIQTVCFAAALDLMGSFFCFSPWGVDFEEAIGLDLWFRLRGAQRPPPDVGVAAIDQASADHFSLPLDSQEWPRSLHARLTQHPKAPRGHARISAQPRDRQRSQWQDGLL